jgi:hypothetical protein
MFKTIHAAAITNPNQTRVTRPLEDTEFFIDLRSFEGNMDIPVLTLAIVAGPTMASECVFVPLGRDRGVTAYPYIYLD